MTGIVLALLSAAFFASNNILGRLGLQYMRATSGVLVSLVASLAMVLVAALVFQFNALVSMPLASMAWFAAAGIMNFPVGRYFKFLGMSRIGTARATSISSGSPFLAVLMAILFLGERLTPLMLAGTLLIVGGLYLIAGEE